MNENFERFSYPLPYYGGRVEPRDPLEDMYGYEDEVTDPEENIQSDENEEDFD